MIQLYQGDCLEVMRTLPDRCVDSVVTDPPYGLKFMGKHWDHGVPSAEVWTEVLRVIKPGGYLLSFGGTRTYHRMTCAIEDGGFEIRDQIGWAFGSGFPKSHNGEWGGTALKPAWEPICMARKPLIGTVEQNWQAHGTGALNIDGCRVDGGARPAREVAPMRDDVTYQGNALAGRVDGTLQSPKAVGCTDLGRWPANLIHDGSDEVLAAFPHAPGQLAPESFTAPSSKTRNTFGERGRRKGGFGDVGAEKGDPVPNGPMYSDKGSAARFFYCAKASKKDRGDDNNHPTVKPTDLMRYLCRLVTPAGGLILDPFMGSGSTGRGAVLEAFDFIGIERDEGYFKIAQDRINAAMPVPEWLK